VKTQPPISAPLRKKHGRQILTRCLQILNTPILDISHKGHKEHKAFQNSFVNFVRFVAKSTEEF
jgi:hypothetical protein